MSEGVCEGLPLCREGEDKASQEKAKQGQINKHTQNNMFGCQQGCKKYVHPGSVP